MIEFEIGGRKVNPNNIGDALERAFIENIAAQIREKVGTIRDPETGEFPTIIVRGKTLDEIQIIAEGSPELVALINERLGGTSEEAGEVETVSGNFKAFLSYTSADADLAERIARELQSNGIETWWDKWCISPGDSLRQKIEEGLSECTHFLVLLTPNSIKMPWVNQEIDAGLVKKLNNKCRFIPVRHKLSASELSPLLSGMLAPEITADEDITQLVNDIHGISKKPPLGPAPQSVQQGKNTPTGYSVAASEIAKLFVVKSKSGSFGDPQFNHEDIARETGLSMEDTKDGLYELSPFFNDDQRYRVMPESSLFAEFDRHWMDWNPEEDALKLAADIMNDESFPSECGEISERYGWEARRLNPAITYLRERDLIRDFSGVGTGKFVMFRVDGKRDELRRFLKSRQ